IPSPTPVRRHPLPCRRAPDWRAWTWCLVGEGSVAPQVSRRRIWRRSTRRGSPVTRRMAGARLPGRIHSILGSRTERRHGGEGEKKAERRGGAVT
uniref:Uncharacterized protein n=1 Tax=Aegilops tauschii subsp. strangulata TaxID=200361 RepID=A0A453EJQ2_AEGTS